MLRYKVDLVLEGIPPHAWDREVAEDLLGSACLVDTVAPETYSRQNLSAFNLSAWTAHPESIPTLRWLAIPGPGLVDPLMELALLQYKVLIHLDSVTEFGTWEEPLFLGASSDSGQSGIPGSDGGPFGGSGGGAGGAAHAHCPPWQFGVRDRRGSPKMGVASAGIGSQGAVGGAGQAWQLPPMAARQVEPLVGSPLTVRHRLSVRSSAFDRLTREVGPVDDSGTRTGGNSNSQGGNNGAQRGASTPGARNEDSAGHGDLVLATHAETAGQVGQDISQACGALALTNTAATDGQLGVDNGRPTNGDKMDETGPRPTMCTWEVGTELVLPPRIPLHASVDRMASLPIIQEVLIPSEPVGQGASLGGSHATVLGKAASAPPQSGSSLANNALEVADPAGTPDGNHAHAPCSDVGTSLPPDQAPRILILLCKRAQFVCRSRMMLELVLRWRLMVHVARRQCKLNAWVMIRPWCWGRLIPLAMRLMKWRA